MKFYNFDIASYCANTQHLDWQEDLAFRRLLDAYYWRELPLPVSIDECCRLVRAEKPEHTAAVETVLREFFTLEDDGWHIERCDREIFKNRTRSSLNNYQRFRSLVLARDGARCAYCGAEDRPLELDHIFPRSRR